MPKRSKKQKLSHQSNPDANRSLSHNEIWDDSALIKSWNAALAEYEYYHSLAAKGLDVDEVLDRAEEAEARGEEVDLALDDAGDVDGDAPEGETVQQGGVNGEEAEEGEVEEGELADDDNDADAPHFEQNVGNGKATRIGPQMPSNVSLQQPEAPAPVAVNGDAGATSMAPDQTLENVKMAYYWAGYYSGMYDAQRQAANGKRPGIAEGNNG